MRIFQLEKDYIYIFIYIYICIYIHIYIYLYLYLQACTHTPYTSPCSVSINSSKIYFFYIYLMKQNCSFKYFWDCFISNKLIPEAASGSYYLPQGSPA